MKMANELAAAGVVDPACIRCAEGHGIAEELARRGIKLAPYGERLATLLREIPAVNVLTTCSKKMQIRY
jgi:hypothetical protein